LLIELLYLILFFFFLTIYCLKKRKQIRINRWAKALSLKKHAQTFQKLYQNINGFILSKKERQKHDALDYVYGEIEFLSFIALLSLTHPNRHTVFYDLGSGTGKAVLACAMVFPIRKSVGIELLPELYLQACKQAKQLAKIKYYAKQGHHIEFILGDFLQVNLTEATTIFINSTALFNPTWNQLCKRLEDLAHLTTVITTSKALSSTSFTVIKQVEVEMSWGVVLAYIHTRKRMQSNDVENIE
jgi:predicted RNA methylase